MSLRPDSALSMPANWRHELPRLDGQLVSLRELRPDDAPALLSLLTGPEVVRFMAPPPTSVEGFERFIAWVGDERARGAYACFAVVPHGQPTAVGLFQLRRLEASFSTAEWGFAMGAPFWGTGLFLDGARLAVNFAFDVLGSTRLEARAAASNGRGNGALRKVGAVHEALLRQALLCRGTHVDQRLWSIVKNDWCEVQSRYRRPLPH